MDRRSFIKSAACGAAVSLAPISFNASASSWLHQPFTDEVKWFGTPHASPYELTKEHLDSAAMRVTREDGKTLAEIINDSSSALAILLEAKSDDGGLVRRRVLIDRRQSRVEKFDGDVRVRVVRHTFYNKDIDVS